MPRYIVRLDYRPRKRGLTVSDYVGTFAAPSPVAALSMAGRGDYWPRLPHKRTSAIGASAELLPDAELGDIVPRRR